MERLSRSELCRRFPSVEDRVKFILERHPEARNDDLYLIILYWRYFDELGRYIRFVPYEIIRKATRPETIRRTRQYVQNTLGLYPPTRESVIRKRRKAEKAMRRIYAMR